METLWFYLDKKILKKSALFFIFIYQKAMAPFPARCRFYPSCSEYTKQAIKKKGFFKGSLQGLLRIIRCHPFNNGGYDPVE